MYNKDYLELLNKKRLNLWHLRNSMVDFLAENNSTSSVEKHLNMSLGAVTDEIESIEEKIELLEEELYA